MLARVTTFEGGTADGIRAVVEQMRSDIPQGPPSGIKSNGLTMLVDPDGGRAIGGPNPRWSSEVPISACCLSVRAVRGFALAVRRGRLLGLTSEP